MRFFILGCPWIATCLEFEKFCHGLLYPHHFWGDSVKILSLKMILKISCKKQKWFWNHLFLFWHNHHTYYKYRNLNSYHTTNVLPKLLNKYVFHYIFKLVVLLMGVRSSFACLPNSLWEINDDWMYKLNKLLTCPLFSINCPRFVVISYLLGDL